MNRFDKHQVRTAAADVAAAVALEVVAIKLARRFTGEHHPHPGRRPVRRFAGVVLSELAEQGAAAIYWQRLRMRAAIDRAAVQQRHAGKRNPLPEIPHQRVAHQEAPAALPDFR